LWRWRWLVLPVRHGAAQHTQHSALISDRVEEEEEEY
jgi:hypothetical protein